MTRIVAATVAVLLAVEVCAFALADRALVVTITGAALAAALLWIRSNLVRHADAVSDTPVDAAANSLTRCTDVCAPVSE